VWNVPPQMSPACFYQGQDVPAPYRYGLNQNISVQPSLFPTKRPQIIWPGGYKRPALLHGTPEEQRPKYSGNEPERPESFQVYKQHG
ncbi:hypothetical protein NL529_28445, partial [Klebsiella pneumoniae]|nr:hypothetical protein [Klebsiella pneumoniae]